MPSIIKNQKASTELVGQVITESVPQEILIYVGPPVIGLQRFSSFVGGYPEHFKNHIGKSPAFRNMFIAPEKLVEVQQRLLDAHSVESMWFKKTAAYFSEVKQ